MKGCSDIITYYPVEEIEQFAVTSDVLRECRAFIHATSGSNVDNPSGRHLRKDFGEGRKGAGSIGIGAAVTVTAAEKQRH